MACPVCKGERIPQDCSVIDERGKREIIQGRVYAIISEDKLASVNYSPFATCLTVSLYPRKGKVKYLKFKTQEELNHWSFEEGESFTVHGCSHIADGKELVFDITQVEPVD